MVFSNTRSRTAKWIVALVAAGGLSQASFAGQVLTSTNGTTRIGINDDGSLDTVDGGRFVGLGYNFTGQSGRTGFQDALTPGCQCEAWGVAANGIEGQVGPDTGNINISVGGASATASSFTSNTSLGTLAGLTVSQVFTLSNETATGALFKNTVTIHNGTGAAVSDVRYARAMDWDVPPSEFDEYSTFVGTGTTTALLRSTDDGFARALPLSGMSNGGILGPINADGTTGPGDHGAFFIFGFGALAAGADKIFNIYYGAGADQADALALLSGVGPELYNLGQSYDGLGRATNLPTYVFAFNGVGGSVVVPPGAVPEPSNWAMMVGGFGLLGGALRRRQRTSVRFA